MTKPPNGGLKRYLKNAKIRSLIYFQLFLFKKTPNKCMRLNDKWDNQKLEKVISSYEIHNSESGIPFCSIAQLQEVGLEPLNSQNLILPQTQKSKSPIKWFLSLKRNDLKSIGIIKTF